MLAVINNCHITMHHRVYRLGAREQIALILAERDRLKEQLDRQRERELRLEENRKLYNNLPQSMKLSANTSTVDGNVSDRDSEYVLNDSITL